MSIPTEWLQPIISGFFPVFFVFRFFLFIFFFFSCCVFSCLCLALFRVQSFERDNDREMRSKLSDRAQPVYLQSEFPFFVWHGTLSLQIWSTTFGQLLKNTYLINNPTMNRFNIIMNSMISDSSMYATYIISQIVPEFLLKSWQNPQKWTWT